MRLQECRARVGVGGDSNTIEEVKPLLTVKRFKKYDLLGTRWLPAQAANASCVSHEDGWVSRGRSLWKRVFVWQTIAELLINKSRPSLYLTSSPSRYSNMPNLYKPNSNTKKSLQNKLGDMHARQTRYALIPLPSLVIIADRSHS